MAVRAPALAAAVGASRRALALAVDATRRTVPQEVRRLEVATVPDDVLKAKAAPVSESELSAARHGRGVVELIAAMRRVAAECPALGLAAPQVSELQRVFIMKTPRTWLDAGTMADGPDPTRSRSSSSSVSWADSVGVRQRPAKRGELFGGGLEGADEWEADVLKGFQDDVEPFVACINPRLLARSSEVVPGWEACLSVPDVTVLVERSVAVDVEFTAEDGETRVRRRLRGLPAVVFQHELDHLDGRLIIDDDRMIVDPDDELCESAEQRYEQELHKHYW